MGNNDKTRKMFDLKDIQNKPLLAKSITNLSYIKSDDFDERKGIAITIIEGILYGYYPEAR